LEPVGCKLINTAVVEPTGCEVVGNEVFHVASLGTNGFIAANSAALKPAGLAATLL
jgi:hypothetical protein